jgi:hypothetical protein
MDSRLRGNDVFFAFAGMTLRVTVAGMTTGFMAG